ncbi:LOG family protein [Patescibacteria group bacterium]|nr:LOG family protein [Patescibacteria group bacterium]MBU1931551.1 LOG family protein [Patescibacteria group bacterium]
MQFIKNVAFFGFADTKPGERLYDQAFKVAQTLAKKGYVIVNGGGPGVMAASTAGAESVGGETLSVTFYPKDAPGFEGRYPKNITDKEIKTGNYIERMFKLFEHGDIYIIFKGGTGTLSEFATAWCLSRLYYGSHKPFILYGDHWKKLIRVFKENMLLRGEENKIFKIVDSTKEVLEAIDVFEDNFEKRLKKYLGNKDERAFMEGGLR